MLIAVTIAAAVALGYEIATRALRDRASSLEIWAAALCIGSTVWIATVWVAALTHGLSRPVLFARTLLIAVAAAILFFRRTRGRIANVEISAAHVLPVLPLIAWVFFLLWRGSVTPPLSHDALAYHLPRAVLWIREGGFRYLDLPIDPRMRLLPANYEMLLADAMLLDGSDRFTEWIAVFFFIAFVIVSGALARRWWESDGAALAPLLLAASVPVLLLHAGADKNDVMTGFFMVSALLWGGRWVGERDRASLVLCTIAMAAAIGTKPQGLLLAAALAPFTLWRFRGIRQVALIAAFAILALTLLGGALFVSRALHEPSSEQQQFVAYDDWANLWQAPWVILAAPFSSSVEELWVPWSELPWFWKRDELFFSSLGVPFVVCLVLIPVAWFLFRRDLPERALERRTISLVAAAVFVLMLPVRDVPMPHGVYVVALPRYVLFLAPVVFALTIAPAVRRAERFAPFIFAALALWFAYSAVFVVRHDRFIPLRYLQWVIKNPGARAIPFDPRRAASAVDAMAGARDVIAMDAGYGAWVHPAFGAQLTRPIIFLEPGQPIPPNAQWVVIDRTWHTIWQHPGFRDISQWRTQLGYGKLTADDLRTLEAVRRDPRFRLVFYNRFRNQAVFRRVR